MSSLHKYMNLSRPGFRVLMVLAALAAAVLAVVGISAHATLKAAPTALMAPLRR